MQSLPDSLRDSIPPELIVEADRWWMGLSPDNRDEIARLCDARREIYLFEMRDPEQENPRITGGKFLPHDDGFGFTEWGEEYFDTLLSNPELLIVYDPPQKTFHIGCHRHFTARDCFQRGFLPKDFQCPFGSDACLMTQIRRDLPGVGLRLIGTPSAPRIMSLDHPEVE